MTERENLLRAVRFERPERIPVNFVINAACWHHYPPEALWDLMAAHPLLFPGFERPSEPPAPPTGRASGETWRGPWGCTWLTTDPGIAPQVISHALDDWGDFASYDPPADPDDPALGGRPWDAVAAGFAAARRDGRLRSGGLDHGHTFLRAIYIRGYENLLLDMMDGEPRLDALLGMIERFNARLVERYVALGAEWMGYPEDLGMQRGPMLSPACFRRCVKPIYERLMAPARAAGCVVHMHSDGDVRELLDDLIDGGVEVINLQDLVNGIDWIADRLKGRVCVDLDVDRQRVTRFGTPEEVDALIRREVETLGSREGGLMLKHGMYPGIPLANAEALMDAMERYSTHFA